MTIFTAVIIALPISIIPLVVEAIIVEDMTFNDDLMILTPHRIYDETNINIFGCYVITLLFRIINPLGTIGKFIHFIFTVGRKD